MTSQTKVTVDLISYTAARTLSEKLADFTSIEDHGGSSGGTLSANSTAINAALTAGANFVFVPSNISYEESLLTLGRNDLVTGVSSYGALKLVFKADGERDRGECGGLILKQQGHSGVQLIPEDYSIAAQPMLTVIKNAGVLEGDMFTPAGVEGRFLQLSNVASTGTDLTAPATPSTGKAVIYASTSGTDTLYVKFASGTTIPLAVDSTSPHLTATTTWDPGSIAHGASESKSVTVTGAVLGDIALASFSLDLQELTISAHVGATNTVHVVLHNATGGAVDLASGTLKVLVLKNYGL